jgi:hypothetical protein
MHEAGNYGPSSSILVPTSCELNGTTVTAEGGYQGGFAPYVYGRYGDSVELYVLTAPTTGFSQGITLGWGGVGEIAAAIGGYGSWQVTATINPSLGQPASCLIAAQPTHDFVGAP